MTVSGVQQIEGETSSSSVVSASLGPGDVWRLSTKGPCSFPAAQGDREHWMLLGSCCRIPSKCLLLQLPGPHTCSQGTTVPHCPAWEVVRGEGEGTASPSVVPCLFTMNYSASKHQGLPWTTRMAFTPSVACVVVVFPHPLPRSGEQVN